MESLLDRGAVDDVAEAGAAVDRLSVAPADEGLVMRDIWSLRLRVLLARSRGDADGLTHCLHDHREMAKMLGYEGHIAWAATAP